jgi:transglutaminase-like putative cysteine protease
MIGAARFAYDPDEATDLALSVARRHPDNGEVEAWARGFVRPSGGTRLSRVLSDMTHAIRETFAYALRMDGPPQTPVETLARRAAACRDFAVLLVEAARSLGLPDCGWVDFDPTNGLVGNQDLVRVAEVIDPRAALPLYGSWSGLKSDFLGMDVEVDLAMVPTMQPATHLRVAHGQ